MQVLLVEDDDRQARAIVELLAKGTEEPIAAQHVHTGAAALQQLKRQPDFDVVLVDPALSDASGPQLVGALVRENPAAPCLVLSGSATLASAREALRLGAQDYLVKGALDDHQLTRAIHFAIERKRIERRLAHEAGHDALTGLLNRARFHEAVGQAVANADRHDTRCALLFIDLDRFKAVNDELGHAAGDELLATVARRLSRVLRQGDVAGRLGGDEFAVLLETVPDRAAAETVAAKIRGALAEPCALGPAWRRVGASIGIALFPDDGRNVDKLLALADRAMYAAKPARRRAGLAAPATPSGRGSMRDAGGAVATTGWAVRITV